LPPVPESAAARAPDRLAVTLAGLRFHVRVGILPHERELPQPIELDVTAWPAGPRRGRGGRLRLPRALRRGRGRGWPGEPLSYLEDVAADVADRVLAGGAAGRVRVAVRKPHVAMPGPVAYAEVVLEREGGAGDRGAAVTADVALGSNLGRPGAHLAAARSAIAALPGTRVLAASRVEETAPSDPWPRVRT
jgi:dihydroneopterin aldolase